MKNYIQFINESVSPEIIENLKKFQIYYNSPRQLRQISKYLIEFGYKIYDWDNIKENTYSNDHFVSLIYSKNLDMFVECVRDISHVDLEEHSYEDFMTLIGKEEIIKYIKKTHPEDPLGEEDWSEFDVNENIN